MEGERERGDENSEARDGVTGGDISMSRSTAAIARREQFGGK